MTIVEIPKWHSDLKTLEDDDDDGDDDVVVVEVVVRHEDVIVGVQTVDLIIQRVIQN